MESYLSELSHSLKSLKSTDHPVNEQCRWTQCPLDSVPWTVSLCSPILSSGLAYICPVPAELVYLGHRTGASEVCQVCMHRAWDS